MDDKLKNIIIKNNKGRILLTKNNEIEYSFNNNLDWYTPGFFSIRIWFLNFKYKLSLDYEENTFKINDNTKKEILYISLLFGKTINLKDIKLILNEFEYIANLKNIKILKCNIKNNNISEKIMNYFGWIRKDKIMYIKYIK